MRSLFQSLRYKSVLLGLACLFMSACTEPVMPGQIAGFKHEFTTVVPGKYKDAIISDDGNKLMLLGREQADTYKLAPDMVKESSTGIVLDDEQRFYRAPCGIFVGSDLVPPAGFSKEFATLLKHYRNWRQYVPSGQGGEACEMLIKLGKEATPVMVTDQYEEPAFRSSSYSGHLMAESLDMRVRAYDDNIVKAIGLHFCKDSGFYRTYKLEQLKLRHEDQIESVYLSSSGKIAAVIMFYRNGVHPGSLGLAEIFGSMMSPGPHACITLLDLENDRILAKSPIPCDSACHIMISYSEQSGKLVLFDWTTGELSVWSMSPN